MNTEDRISIIVPVYNVAEYLPKCLDSLTGQTYKNIEILCVNDGSTDNGGDICEQYAKKDARVRVFHKENEGVASARNFALERVTGNYIGFVDSDDWIESEMYETLYNAICKNDVELACCNYNKVYAEKTVCMKNEWAITEDIIEPEQVLYYAFNRDHHMGFGAYLCNKLFKIEILNNRKFKPDIKYAEDVVLFSEIVIGSNARAVYVPEPLYNYFQRSSSASNSCNMRVRSDSLVAYREVLQLLFGRIQYQETERWVKRFYCYHASLLAELARQLGELEKLKYFQQEIQKYLPEYLETNKEYPDRIQRIQEMLNW